MNFRHGGNGIAGFAAPVLAFAAIGRQRNGVAIRQMKIFVDVEGGLHAVIAGGKIGESRDGIAENRIVQRDGLPVRQIGYILPVDLLRGEVVLDLLARIALGFF